MEGQTHVTHGKKRRKKNEPIVSLHEKSDKPSSGKKKPGSLRSRSVTPSSGEKKNEPI